MIDIPEPLKWVGTYLFIGDFPEANEDLLNQMAATYDQVATDIQRLSSEVIADARALDNVLQGQAADAILAVLHNVARGHDTGLTDLAAQLDKAGTLLDVTALQVIAAKLYYIYSLVEAAITIALAIAAAAETFSASLAAIPVTVAITRTVITQIIKQLVHEIIENLVRNAVKRIALNAAEGAGEAIVLETARQVVEKTIGFRENYDLNKIIEQAVAGAQDGAIEGTIHDTAHRLGHHNDGTSRPSSGSQGDGTAAGIAPTGAANSTRSSDSRNRAGSDSNSGRADGAGSGAAGDHTTPTDSKPTATPSTTPQQSPPSARHDGPLNLETASGSHPHPASSASTGDGPSNTHQSHESVDPPYALGRQSDTVHTAPHSPDSRSATLSQTAPERSDHPKADAPAAKDTRSDSRTPTSTVRKPLFAAPSDVAARRSGDGTLAAQSSRTRDSTTGSPSSSPTTDNRADSHEPAGEVAGVFPPAPPRPNVEMRMPAHWTPQQQQAMLDKVRSFNNRVEAEGFEKTKPPRRDPGVRNRFLGSLGLNRSPTGTHVDHVRDLQAGGTDTADNMQLLDVSVNTSFGSQLRREMTRHPVRTVFGRVEIIP
ncbi:MAG: hypothetical protein LLG14_16800 [Nocardiaceae bacterium]|nr:hypothetical protein [Nocardiaceae bacterium]